MRNSTLLLVVLLAMFLTFEAGQLLRPDLASLLLTMQLSSDEHVAKDIASDPSGGEMVYNNTPIHTDLADIIPFVAQAQGDTQVLGDSTGRWIEVNLTQQRLYAWDGTTLFGNYLISSGKWAPTPTGDFKVWIKLASTRMTGGSVALGTYYDLPNVPCTMYFYKGYGIHGTYWHNNFGHPMSHGCINMKTPEACQVFNWASVGTRVYIHY